MGDFLNNIYILQVYFFFKKKILLKNNARTEGWKKFLQDGPWTDTLNFICRLMNILRLFLGSGIYISSFSPSIVFFFKFSCG